MLTTPTKNPDTSSCPPKPRRPNVPCERGGKPLRLRFETIAEQGHGAVHPVDEENHDPHQGAPGTPVELDA